MAENNKHYQAPPHYSSGSGGGYYPYTSPPPKANETQQRQHAYDVAYRVGQDDFHHHLSKHFTRHPDLFDDLTHDAFRTGYESGYDAAREGASRRGRPYTPPAVHHQHVPSEHSSSGYYPYASTPSKASGVSATKHAYEVGFRVGQDDFHKGLSKHFTRHDRLFNKETHDSFKLCYEDGYDHARAHK